MIEFWKNVASGVSSSLDINDANLSGCVDVVVVRQKDGTLKSSPFHVRFGKFHILKSKDQRVSITVNNHPTNIIMKLGSSGEGYFEEVLREDKKFPDYLEIPEDDQSIEFQGIDEEPKEREQENNNKIYAGELEHDEGRQSFLKLFERNEYHSTPVKRLVYPGSNNNPRKVKIAEYIQSKIEKGRIISERIKSALTKEFAGHHPEESERSFEIPKNTKEADEENRQAEQILKLIKEGNSYEFSVRQINQINEFFTPIPFSEISENPSEFLNNKNLLVKINGKTHDHNIAHIVLSSLLQNKSKTLPPLFLEEFSTEVDEEDIGQEEEINPIKSWNKYTSRMPNSNLLSSISTKIQETQQRLPTLSKQTKDHTRPKIKKALRLNSEALLSLNLKPGVNTITYTIHTDLQGTNYLSANIYLYEHNTKIIVTDIDGTVTKSDVLGAILPMLGYDWSQPGIVPLFSNIKRNGYQILYLTTRAIGQICFTRSFVNNLQQDGVKLPQGPILSSPDRLLTCFRREMIISRPEYYKAAALRDIRNLFPPDTNPFYAAFGNRENDAVAYRFVGIPLEKIFTVNPNGDIHHSKALFKSYPMMNSRLKELFPCLS